MFLAVFDLDGTLADTLVADHRCFIDAFRLEHGIRFAADDWSSYRSTTDSGITPEVLERHLGRPPTAAEVERHKRRFIELLEAAGEKEPEVFHEVAGSARLLAELGARRDWWATSPGIWPRPGISGSASWVSGRSGRGWRRPEPRGCSRTGARRARCWRPWRSRQPLG